eukprot:6175081-Pleurochrysis_carterae.AAC.2
MPSRVLELPEKSPAVALPAGKCDASNRGRTDGFSKCDATVPGDALVVRASSGMPVVHCLRAQRSSSGLIGSEPQQESRGRPLRPGHLPARVGLRGTCSTQQTNASQRLHHAHPPVWPKHACTSEDDEETTSKAGLQQTKGTSVRNIQPGCKQILFRRNSAIPQCPALCNAAHAPRVAGNIVHLSTSEYDPNECMKMTRSKD